MAGNIILQHTIIPEIQINKQTNKQTNKRKKQIMTSVVVDWFVFFTKLTSEHGLNETPRSVATKESYTVLPNCPMQKCHEPQQPANTTQKKRVNSKKNGSSAPH